jgi:hypothetical protein
MSDDIDTKLRAALTSGVAHITKETLRRPTLPPAARSKTMTWAIAACAAAAVVAAPVIVLTVNNNTTATSANAQAYMGHQWQLRSITQANTTTPVPATLGASATFYTDGRLLLRDSVNTLSGRIEATSDGFAVRDSGTTLALYAGDDRVRHLAINAMAMVSAAEHVVASVADDQLTLAVGEFQIVFVRGGAVANEQPPPLTGSTGP